MPQTGCMIILRRSSARAAAPLQPRALAAGASRLSSSDAKDGASADSYDLSACGVHAPVPYEDAGGNPTDLQAVFAKGGKAVGGGSKRYAANWERIFGQHKPTGEPGERDSISSDRRERQ